MRFVDSNVFLYAYLRPKRELSESEATIKRAAREIVKRIEEGEEVVTTVVHVSEILNIVESRINLTTSLELLETLLAMKNFRILPVDESDYLIALEIARRYAVSVNDAIAYVKMKELGIREIYTFDKHFRNFPDVRVITESL